MNTNQKGKIAELLAIAKYIELGYVVLEPVNKDGIYDFVFERDGIFVKAQVKTLTDRGSLYELRTKSTTMNCKRVVTRSYLQGEIDVFVGVDITNNLIYEIPFCKCNKYTLNLRKTPTSNSQSKGVIFAKDFLV